MLVNMCMDMNMINRLPKVRYLGMYRGERGSMELLLIGHSLSCAVDWMGYYGMLGKLR